MDHMTSHMSLTSHCATLSYMTWMTDDGPPLEPNISSPFMASSAAWGGVEGGSQGEGRGEVRDHRRRGEHKRSVRRETGERLSSNAAIREDYF